MSLKHLYKYRSWEDKYHKKLITDNEIFFTSTAYFNDPFEGCIPLRYEDAPDDYHLNILKKHIKIQNPYLGGQRIKYLAKQKFKKREHLSNKRIREVRESVKNKYENKFGLFTLSETHQDIIMWSHYALSHEGFCVEFDVKALEKYFYYDYFNKNNILIDRIKIIYTDTMPRLIPSEMDETEIYYSILQHKYSGYSYEKEHRYICSDVTNLKINLPDGLVTSIYFGCKMDKNDKDEIISIIENKSAPIKLYESTISQDEFILNFKQII